MSGREYSSKDYPLPYVIPDIHQWPIYRLSEDKDKFVDEVKHKTVERLKEKFKTERGMRDELAKVLYQERIRLTEKPWKADPPDERQFWNGVKSKLIKLDQHVGDDTATEDTMINDILDRYTNEIV